MSAGIGFHSSEESEEMVHNRRWADGCEMQIRRKALILNPDCANVTTPSSVVVLVLVKLNCSILHELMSSVETQGQKGQGHYLLVLECLTLIQMTQGQMGAYMMTWI